MWHWNSYRWNTLFGDGHSSMIKYAPDYSFDRRY